jgi:hypothetical protein
MKATGLGLVNSQQRTLMGLEQLWQILTKEFKAMPSNQ